MSRLTIGWTVQGWKLGEGEIFHTHPDWPWGPTLPSVQWVPVFFPGGKVAGAW